MTNAVGSKVQELQMVQVRLSGSLSLQNHCRDWGDSRGASWGFSNGEPRPVNGLQNQFSGSKAAFFEETEQDKVGHGGTDSIRIEEDQMFQKESCRA